MPFRSPIGTGLRTHLRVQPYGDTRRRPLSQFEQLLTGLDFGIPGLFQPRPTTRPGFAALARHALDAREKALVAQRLALVEGEADVVDRRRIELVAKQRAICRAPCGIGRAQRQIERMRREQRVGLAEPVGCDSSSSGNAPDRRPSPRAPG